MSPRHDRVAVCRPSVGQEGSIMSDDSSYVQLLSSTRTFIGRIVDQALWRLSNNSASFWNLHYRLGGTSGPGSSGDLCHYKATFLNRFVEEQGVKRVIEFGCGNGDQLQEATYPEYIGLDVSAAAIRLIADRFALDAAKSFFVYHPLGFVDRCRLFHADLAISLDVVFHLTDDRLYQIYLRHLFDSSNRWVIVYSSNEDQRATDVPYTRHREFIRDVAEFREWALVREEINPHGALTRSRFFLFERMEGPHGWNTTGRRTPSCS